MTPGLLAERVLTIIRRRAGARGRCSIDVVELVWGVRGAWPGDDRPKLHEVERAIEDLRRRRLVRSPRWPIRDGQMVFFVGDGPTPKEHGDEE